MEPTFSELFAGDELPRKLAEDAEFLCHDHPDLALVRCRQLIECLALRMVRLTGELKDERADLLQLIRLLEERDLLSLRLRNAFHRVRLAGNRAVHTARAEERDARKALDLTHAIVLWFRRSTTVKPDFSRLVDQVHCSRLTSRSSFPEFLSLAEMVSRSQHIKPKVLRKAAVSQDQALRSAELAHPFGGKLVPALRQESEDAFLAGLSPDLRAFLDQALDACDKAT